ncbi:cAMP-dependent protein kinase [Ranunculus cassubicifolius]
MDLSRSREDSGNREAMSNYRIGSTIGVGSFGKVKKAEYLPTKKKVAIKILDLPKIRKEAGEEERVRREIKIMKFLKHPHVITLYEVIETNDAINFVMEYMESGDLYDYIQLKRRLQEDEARKIFQQIISAVEYCHKNMVVHRDLKPENILLDSNLNIKIADFGLSNFMRDGHFLKTSCGSIHYAAPEVLSGQLYAGPEVDVWSCGIILYALLCGELAFDDENTSSLIRKIKNAIFTIPRHVSDGARDLIKRMLVVDPMKRMTILDIRQHPWFQVHLPQYMDLPSPEPLHQKISSTNEASSSSSTEHRLLGVTNHLGKKWALGFQSGANPRNIMLEVLSAFLELKVTWKRISSYNMKCRWFPSLQVNEGIPHQFDGESTIAESSGGGGKGSPDMVKFEMQLYKTGDGSYVVDLQRVDGQQLIFLDICASLFAQLRDPYRRLHRSMVLLA